MRRVSSRALAAVLATGIVAAACGGPATATGGTPTPWSTASSSPTSSPSPSQTVKPGDFEIAMGQARPLVPADDFGADAATSINDFGFDVLRRLDPHGNLCASPTSIALALAMTRAGARGQTATEMDTVLHSLGSDANAREIVALMQSFRWDTYYESGWRANWDDPSATPDLQEDPLIELEISNAVFSQKGMALQPAYLDALSARFAAGVGLLDFAADPEGARKAINKWAGERTRGRIPEVLRQGDVDDLTRIALANAIYLKAAWDSPFDKTNTQLKPFSLSGGSKVSVPTMAIDRKFPYAAGSGWKAIDLRYATGYMSMTLIVPDDMASFTAGLTAARFQSIVSQETERGVDLTVPRFSAETRVDLVAVLRAMGMPTVFDPSGADLSGITQDARLYIAKVIHQANIDVVEQGTTAAAVTVALGATTGGGEEPTPPPHVTFHIDKPFLYFIRDTSSGAVLFMGRIDDPSAES